MNDYYIRTTLELWPTMLQFGVQLGVITLTYTEFEESINEDGFPIKTPIGDPIVSATHGGSWDYIGEIQLPTGEQETVGEFTVPVVSPIKDSEGNAYLHGNLRTPINLRERAEEIAVENPSLAEAMSNLGQFFLLDGEGNARLPNNPHRVWL
ncbi:MAG: hypothetical protein Q8K97_12480 [Pseudohongiella sp.]|nr:hypothetical protein [Pseudohongiella sp.]